MGLFSCKRLALSNNGLSWVLLCHSNFFPHYYPELKGVVGPQMFGYNKKQHILHFVLDLPLSAVLAWVCTLL